MKLPQIPTVDTATDLSQLLRSPFACGILDPNALSGITEMLNSIKVSPKELTNDEIFAALCALERLALENYHRDIFDEKQLEIDKFGNQFLKGSTSYKILISISDARNRFFELHDVSTSS